MLIPPIITYYHETTEQPKRWRNITFLSLIQHHSRCSHFPIIVITSITIRATRTTTARRISGWRKGGYLPNITLLSWDSKSTTLWRYEKYTKTSPWHWKDTKRKMMSSPKISRSLTTRLYRMNMEVWPPVNYPIDYKVSHIKVCQVQRYFFSGIPKISEQRFSYCCTSSRQCISSETSSKLFDRW